MNVEEFLDIPSEVGLIVVDDGGNVRFEFRDAKTNFMDKNDYFIKRIRFDNLNKEYLEKHLLKEITVKNKLDDGISYLNNEKFPKAISCFDDVLYYDENYSDALINKSHALFGEKHFVKALRFYKRAVKSGCVEDIEYHKLLLKESSIERDNFPKIKRNIYAGDEAAARGEFEKAVDFYQKALANPSKFKDKILFKLLNKKAFVLLKLNRFDEALDSFDNSLKVHENDFAYFGRGYCQYKLGVDCLESFDKAVDIDKKRLLCKALILNELGYYQNALDSLNIFLDNHFIVDDDYNRAWNAKKFALKELQI